MDSTGPIEKVVETEENLHIFGLVGAVYGAGPAAQERATCRGNDQPGRAKATIPREETPFVHHHHQPAYPPNRYDEFAGTGRDGGGWGMATGRETPGAVRHEERRSAAVPRALTMNVDMVS